MLQQIKLTTIKAPAVETASGFNGMFGGVYVHDAEVKCHSAKFWFGQFVADVELRVVSDLLATANVNQHDVHVDILRALRETQKSPEKVMEALAELHTLRVLTSGLYQ